MVVNAGSGATSNYLKGDDPLKGGLISSALSRLGYSAGKLVELPFDKTLNPMKPWKDWIWTGVGFGISKPLPINPVPGVAGNITGSVTTEYGNAQAGKAPDSGNIAVTGSALRAGGDIVLDAQHDITLLSAQNPQTVDGKNSSQGNSVEVGITFGSNGMGFNVNVSVNATIKISPNLAPIPATATQQRP
ncbi:hemagglutinin repeat-containing protein [Edwardsiella piscicida]|uniref:hemagglutinin repeat-containing protein n=1 Tax=Edwardsiella piscicida TaxID=1263550 RepID=UPI00299E8592|nr:hemagglutinin repeat-containing protein [Edwardsiella piscicida]